MAIGGVACGKVFEATGKGYIERLGDSSTPAGAEGGTPVGSGDVVGTEDLVSANVDQVVRAIELKVKDEELVFSSVLKLSEAFSFLVESKLDKNAVVDDGDAVVIDKANKVYTDLRNGEVKPESQAWREHLEVKCQNDCASVLVRLSVGSAGRVQTAMFRFEKDSAGEYVKVLSTVPMAQLKSVSDAVSEFREAILQATQPVVVRVSPESAD
jgi:hypothetical protein